MSLSTSLNLGSSQNTTTLPAAQEVKTKIGKPISYAETTRVFVDETARAALIGYGFVEIRRLAGRDLSGIVQGIVKSISIRDARMINQGAGTQIIKLDAAYIDRFTIDPLILERLEGINLKQACVELGFTDKEVYDFKLGRTQTIGKEHGEKYYNYFKKINGMPQAEIFDRERIFQLALAEPISKKEKKLSELTSITIEDKHRKELNELPDKITLSKWVGYKFSSNREKTIPIKSAILIHKISGKIIFTFNKEAVAKIPILPAHLEELDSLRQKFKEEHKNIDQKIQKTIVAFNEVNRNCTGRELAEKINSYFEKDVFDFESILAQAVQEAEDEVKEMEFPALSKKRPRSDSSSSTEDSSEPNSKKQRTVEKTAQPRMAIVLDDEMPSARDESGGEPNHCQFPPTAPDKPVELAPKSKHDLSFLLNKKVQQ